GELAQARAKAAAINRTTPLNASTCRKRSRVEKARWAMRCARGRVFSWERGWFMVIHIFRVAARPSRCLSSAKCSANTQSEFYTGDECLAILPTLLNFLADLLQCFALVRIENMCALMWCKR